MRRYDAERLRKTIREFRADTSALFADNDFVALVRSTMVEIGRVFREDLYNPAVTLWIFLTQVLSTDHSCRNAVAKFSVPVLGIPALIGCRNPDCVVKSIRS
jgi:hypothetical protein